RRDNAGDARRHRHRSLVMARPRYRTGADTHARTSRCRAGLAGRDMPPARTTQAPCSALEPPTRAVARVGYEQLSGGVAVLSQVQVFVPFGWVATMRNEVGSPVQLEKTTP